MVIQYNPTLEDRTQFSTLQEPLILDKENDLVEFEFCGFTIKEFSETKAMLRLKPKKQGLFKLESLLFSVLNIPRRFDFDNAQNSSRNHNCILISDKSLRESWFD